MKLDLFELSHYPTKKRLCLINEIHKNLFLNCHFGTMPLTTHFRLTCQKNLTFVKNVVDVVLTQIKSCKIFIKCDTVKKHLINQELNENFATDAFMHICKSGNVINSGSLNLKQELLN
jgi:hypothetical protein